LPFINGYIAFRGVTGSTITSVAINAIQLVFTNVIFNIGIHLPRLLILGWHMLPPCHPFCCRIILGNVIFQSTIAILLLVGFESVTAFRGLKRSNPKKDYS